MEDIGYALGYSIGQFLRTALLWGFIIGAILLLARYMLHRGVDSRPKIADSATPDAQKRSIEYRNRVILIAGGALGVLYLMAMCSQPTTVAPRTPTPAVLTRIESKESSISTASSIPAPSIELPTGLELTGLVSESLIGSPHVAFALTNIGNASVKSPRFYIVLYKGTVIVQESDDWCSDLTLAPGDWDYCDMYLEDYDAWTSWAIRVVPGDYGSDRSLSSASAGLEIASTEFTNGRTLTGQIDNVSGASIDHITVIAAAYGSDGQICALGDGYAKAETIPADMSSLYEIYSWTGDLSQAKTFKVVAYERY
jgi:hypothetical protein